MVGNYYNNYNPYGYSNPVAYDQYKRELAMMSKKQPSPFQNVLFLNEDEIKGRITDPGTSDLLIDRDKHIAYVKSADTMGFSSTKAYKIEEVIEQEPNEANKGNTMANIDMSAFVNANDFKETIDKLQKKIDDLENKFKVGGGNE